MYLDMVPFHLGYQEAQNNILYLFKSLLFCLTLWDPMDYNMPDFPVLHHLPEFAHTHVHWVGDAIQLSHPLLSPSPPVFNLPQHGGSLPMSWLFASGGPSIGVSVQHQSFQWIFRVDFLQDWLVWSPCCPRDSQESSPASVSTIIFSVLSLSIFVSYHLSLVFTGLIDMCLWWKPPHIFWKVVRSKSNILLMSLIQPRAECQWHQVSLQSITVPM